MKEKKTTRYLLQDSNKTSVDELDMRGDVGDEDAQRHVSDLGPVPCPWCSSFSLLVDSPSCLVSWERRS